jgi:hypothetical protein
MAAAGQAEFTTLGSRTSPAAEVIDPVISDGFLNIRHHPLRRAQLSGGRHILSVRPLTSRLGP